MAKRDHNLAERQATYFQLKLDEKHCPIEGHFGTHDVEGGVEQHRMRDLFSVMMFLGWGQTLDKPIEDEHEVKYAEHHGDREFVNIHIENGQANVVMHLSGTFARVRGVADESGRVSWTGPECPDDWIAELDLVEGEKDDHPSTRLAQAMDDLTDGVKAVMKELVNDER